MPTADVAPALGVDCPRCAAVAGSPCWRSYPASTLTGSAQRVEPIPGYCQARHALARGRAVQRQVIKRTEDTEPL